MRRTRRLPAGTPLLFLPLLFCVFRVHGNGAAKITVRNPTADNIEIRWDDGSADGILVVALASRRETVLDSFDGHSFKVARKTNSGKLEYVDSFTVTLGEDVYTVPGSAAVEAPNGMTIAMRKLREETGAVDFLRSSAGGLAELPMRLIIKNFRRYELERHWDNGKDGVFQGVVQPMGQEDGVTTYAGHVFKMARGKDKEQEIVARFVMDYEQRVYVIEPEPHDVETLQSALYLNHLKEMEFLARYRADHGIPWLGSYPPNPPTLPMHPAPAGGLGTLAHTVRIRGVSRADGVDEDTTLGLIALSSGAPEGPRAFLIKDLLTAEECDHIIKESAHLLRRSTVGNSNDDRYNIQDTRTSENVFIKSSITPTMKLIHRRFADVLNVTDDDLDFAAEQLQVVRYKKGQQYAPHYDSKASHDMARMATLLVYIESAPDKQGGTSFPRAFDDRGLKLSPSRGSAVLFYSMLEDGNLDELALHAGLPVQEGEKMVCNLWLHAHGRAHRRSSNLEL